VKAELLKVVASRLDFGRAVMWLRRRVTLRGIEREPLSAGIPGSLHRERADVGVVKPATDVLVDGFAFADGVRRESRVEVELGSLHREVLVIGQRRAALRDGRLGFTDPEPFERVPLTDAEAFGGTDHSVEVGLEGLPWAAVVEHPGSYPRNPSGKGYTLGRAEGVLLPRLEDPEDRLTPDRLGLESPRSWATCPMPAALDWQPPLSFPRSSYLGVDPWAGPPRGTIKEEQLGRWRRPGALGLLQFDPRFLQEARPGMTLDRVEAGAVASVSGAHPAMKRVELELPPSPRVTIGVDGVRTEATVRLQTVLLRPHEASMSLTFVAWVPLPRAFVPGVHTRLPIEARVDDVGPIACEPFVVPGTETVA
jgi:hypothetical protein